MANFFYDEAADDFAKGDIDLIVDDIRLMMVDSSTTTDTERATLFIDDFTTLGELSGTGYVRKALGTKAINKDAPNNRSEFTCADVVFTAINAGTAQAAVVYKHVTTDADSIPIAYIDQVDFPIVTNGGDVTLNINAEGLLQFSA